MRNVDSANQFFRAVASRGNEPRLADSTGTWQFDVDGVGTWTIDVENGSLSVAAGPPAEPPTVCVGLSEAELVHLANGEDHENPLTGVLRGDIRIAGNLRFARQLYSILPVPDDWEDP